MPETWWVLDAQGLWGVRCGSVDSLPAGAGVQGRSVRLLKKPRESAICRAVLPPTLCSLHTCCCNTTGCCGQVGESNDRRPATRNKQYKGDSEYRRQKKRIASVGKIWGRHLVLGTVDWSLSNDKRAALISPLPLSEKTATRRMHRAQDWVWVPDDDGIPLTSLPSMHITGWELKSSPRPGAT